MALPIFAITIFVSAFLLFLVQPMVGKMILPKLGGTPQVWNTCMVFFQSVLLAGYAYTHSVSTRFKLRQQLMIHGGLLALPIVIMLIFPMYLTVQNWYPPTEGSPIPNALMLLFMIVGIPFFVVSTSAPLLQKWFGYSGHETASDPYFLYSASNLGSLLSLFFYPTLLEPFTMLHIQGYIWFGGYVVLAALILYCAFTIYKTAPSDDSILAAEAASMAPSPSPETPAPAPAVVVTPAAPDASTSVKAGPGPGGASGRGIQRKKGMKVPGNLEDEKASVQLEAPRAVSGAQLPMTVWRRIRWVLLAAVPSSLMLGVTSYISTDLSPFPLVWVIPLALYLLSFIFVYTRISTKRSELSWTGTRFLGNPGYTLHQMVLYVFQPLGLMVLCFVILRGGFDPFLATGLVIAGFFACALACHGELAQDRPDTKHLTEYFLLMSVGGMVGGVFNGIIAPIVFQGGVYEFYVAIVIACFVRPQYVPSGWFDELILNAFPQFHGWVKNQGDEMAKSMGRPAPRTSYMFNYFLDFVFGLFVLALGYYLLVFVSQRDLVPNVLKFFQLPMTQKWASIIRYGISICIPLIFCFFFAGRPVRLTLAIAGLLIGHLYLASSDNRDLLDYKRTYFGLLKVMQDKEFVNDEQERDYFNNPEKPLVIKGNKVCPFYPYTFLMHGTTYHGRNYYKYFDDEYAKNRVDLSRLATTYYHRYGPVGVVFEQYNKLPGRQNTFYEDLRTPVALIGQMVSSVGVGSMPLLPAMVATWTEPPYATIGLGTGTMASYSHPYQFMTYYEIDEAIREFSIPPEGKEAWFTYVQSAIRRGANIEVIMGDARQSLEPSREDKNTNNSLVYTADFTKKDRPILEPPAHSAAPGRDGFYEAIVVDAFSSDAIPIHLCTKEALALYMRKMTDTGVLLMHTSNRHMDLVRPVARIAKALGVNCKVGKDSPPKERYMGLFGSEYVMLYKGDGFANYLEALAKEKEALIEAKVMVALPADEREPTQYGRAPNGKQILNSGVVWYNPFEDNFETIQGHRYQTHRKVTDRDSLWTDDYSYILGVLR